ncbi:hypothetical protein [Sporisorium scitamineum]|uniref:Uncharacterized protein n=1 Tax=Sporisorium scitamineum TaxID=49012 RepID=A0A0F7RWE2_9BASI|nr:hypothetical protein [Sporisorium scitamineum]
MCGCSAPFFSCPHIFSALCLSEIPFDCAPLYTRLRNISSLSSSLQQLSPSLTYINHHPYHLAAFRTTAKDVKIDESAKGDAPAPDVAAQKIKLGRRLSGKFGALFHKQPKKAEEKPAAEEKAEETAAPAEAAAAEEQEASPITEKNLPRRGCILR